MIVVMVIALVVMHLFKYGVTANRISEGMEDSEEKDKENMEDVNGEEEHEESSTEELEQNNNEREKFMTELDDTHSKLKDMNQIMKMKINGIIWRKPAGQDILKEA